MTEPPTKVKAGDDFKCEAGCSVHVFPGPMRIERTERQSSAFSFADFEGDYVIKPLDEIVPEKSLSKFSVPSELKRELRELLADLNLDAWSVYGGPAALGKSMSSKLYRSV